MDKLLPCPFCGATPKLEITYILPSGTTGYDVVCGTKGCFLEYGAEWNICDQEKIIQMYNKRAQPIDPTYEFWNNEDDAVYDSE